MLAAPDEIMTVMSRMLGGHLCASRCAYADVDTDGDQFTILHDYTDGCPSTVGQYHLSLFGPRAVATLRSGQTALDAAGTIHTDIARGFIRCEVVDWRDLVELGSHAEVARQGKQRLEGKTYVVADGDVLNVRFNV